LFATGIGHNGLLLYCRQLILIFRISNKNSLKYQEYFIYDLWCNVLLNRWNNIMNLKLFLHV